MTSATKSPWISLRHLEKLAGLVIVTQLRFIYVCGQGGFHDEITTEVAEVTRGKSPLSDVRWSTVMIRLGLTCCMRGLYTEDDDASTVVDELTQ